MQAVLLEVLQQGAASAVDDALGHPGGAAGIQNVERLSKGQGGERRAAGRLADVVPVNSGYHRGKLGQTRLHAAVTHHDQLLQAAQLRQDFRQLAAHVQLLASVAMAAAGNQYPRLDLAEAVDYALRTKVRRAG